MLGIGKQNLAGLERTGLIVDVPSSDVLEEHHLVDAARLFVSMLNRFDVELVPVTRPGCPVYFCTGIMKQNSDAASGRPLVARSFPGGGQGHNAAAAALSCLGEMAERLSLCTIGVDDPRVFDKRRGMQDLDPGSCIGFSTTQLNNLARRYPAFKNSADAGVFDWRELSQRRVSVAVPGLSATAQLPSFAALFNEGLQGGSKIPGVASTVGSAVWRNFYGARERAYLELIERDAVSRSWYNRMGITRVQLPLLRRSLGKNLVEYLESEPREWVVLLVECEFCVHVAMAFSYAQDGRWAAFGSSAAWKVPDAISGAVLEMLQSENSLKMMDAAHATFQNGASGENKMPKALAYARNNSIFDDIDFANIGETSGVVTTKRHSFAALLEQLHNRGISVWEFDATRPDCGIPCIKLFSPELCSWEARFGKSRLYEAADVLDDASREAMEENYSKRPFPF